MKHKLTKKEKEKKKNALQEMEENSEVFACWRIENSDTVGAFYNGSEDELYAIFRTVLNMDKDLTAVITEAVLDHYHAYEVKNSSFQAFFDDETDEDVVPYLGPITEA